MAIYALPRDTNQIVSLGISGLNRLYESLLLFADEGIWFKQTLIHRSGQLDDQVCGLLHILLHTAPKLLQVSSQRAARVGEHLKISKSNHTEGVSND